MKKILTRFQYLSCIIYFVINAGTSNAQMVYVPDSNFRAKLVNLGYSSCMSGDSIDSSCPMVANATSLNVSYGIISDLQGIQAFASLQSLDCTQNALTVLPPLPNTLMYLNCAVNSISSLPALPASLGQLNCEGNSLTSLPALPASLVYLDCQVNELTSLPTLPNSLQTIECSYNHLTALPSSLPTALESLSCEGCTLTYLPVLPGLLNSLNCRWNQISSVPNFPNSLGTIDISGNQMTSLPALPNFLGGLSCGGNLLSTLPALPNSLQSLECSTNQLTMLPTLPSSLTYLDCSDNLLTNLPSLSNFLFSLNCAQNQLVSLPALPGSLTTLYCDYNLLTALPVLPSSLTYLICNDNQLSSLPALPNSLQNLNCSNNLLSSLPTLPNSLIDLYTDVNPLGSLPALPNSLTLLSCQDNQLTTLPALPNSLKNLSCGSNQLISLPDLPDTMNSLYLYNNPTLQCLPKLNYIYQLYLQLTGITCRPNYSTIINCYPPLNGYPLCGLFNPNGCQVYWNISGKTYSDINNNCADDSADIRQQNMHLKLYQGNTLLQQAFTNPEGNYSFDTDTFGIYEVRLDTAGIPFDVLCPSSGSYFDTLSVNDTLMYGRDFALKCKNSYDVGAWSIVSGSFRPAAFSTVNISAGDVANFYGVHCAAGISGTIQVVLSGPVSYSAPAPNSIPPSIVSGDTITWNVADFSTTNITGYNIVVQTDTNALINSQICVNVTVTSNPPGDYNPANATLSHCFAVVASFDPNNKAVSPVGYADMNGDRWLTYTIRFQNTGTAPAEHIYITDTLDANLDLATFQLLAYSHQPYVQILEGGIARFNFPNINLLDSNSNEPASHGYIQYKVKFLNGLPPGTPIENTAYIYFDFNSPVVTNTTVNIIGSGPFIYVAGNPSVCSAGCTNIAAGVANGLPPFTYSWTPSIGAGPGPYSVCPNSTTTYSVVISDVNNISASASITVTVHPPPAAIITPSGPTTFCQGDSVTLTSSAASSYLWSDNSTTQSINIASSGSYFVTVTNAVGCTASSSAVSVTVNPLPNASVTPGGPTTFCQGDSVTLTTWAAYSYLWSTGATTHSINVTASGNYSVTASSSAGCSATSPVLTVTVNPLPNAFITPSGPTTFCQGNSVTLTSSAANNYLWSNSALTQSINVTSSGNYSVTVTDANNCSASTSLSVTVNPLPVASITPSGPTTFCQGNSVTLTSSAANSYLWSNSSSTQSINVTSTGNYSVTVTDTNNCSASTSLSVTVNPLPTASITPSGPTTLCQGNSVTLTSSVANNYLWSNSASTQSINVTSSGNYSVTVTDANNCSASTSLSVTVYPNPPMPAITQGGDSLISDLASGYQWYFNSVLIPGATLQSYHPLQNGNYSVVITDANNCTASSTDYTWVLTEAGNFTNDEGVIIYPNPARGELVVRCSEFGDKSEILIYNLPGKIILSQKPEARSKKQVINVSALPRGIYFIKVKLEEKFILRKVVLM